MADLYFKNPVFNSGYNLTVRRGVKWDVADKENVLIIDADYPVRDDGRKNVLHVVDIETRVMRFCDLTDADLQYEHDQSCTTVTGLLIDLQSVYRTFDMRELVTLVMFYLENPNV